MKKLALLSVLVCILGIVTSCTQNNKNLSEVDTTQWVDLGLPSGLLWATCNLGANSPEEYGDYYAWGETKPKSTYDWSTYKYCNGSYGQITKYCTNQRSGNNGFTDNLTTLQAMDDISTQLLGTEARLPTKDEWEELIGGCTVEWITMNGVHGCRCTSNANGNSLFLPTAGCRYEYDNDLTDIFSEGAYWSSLLSSSNSNWAWAFRFNSTGSEMQYTPRYEGLSVRAVRPQ